MGRDSDPNMTVGEDNPDPGHEANLANLADFSFDFWEPEKYDPSETRVKMGTDVLLPVRVDTSVPPELAERLAHWNLKETTVSIDTLTLVLRLLDHNSDVFSKSEYDVGCFTGFKHSVNTGTNYPIKAKPRPLSHAKLQCLAKILDDLLKAKLITPSRSDWACAIVLVPKRNGSWRLCMDYRPLNRIATCCQFPLPRIADMLQTLRGSKFFTALDLNKGFHQIPLEEESKPKLAFVTPMGLFQWEKTPFGIHSGPAVFQAAMQLTLAGLEHCTMVYIDDIIIFTKDFPSHLKAVQAVFDRLREFNLKVSREKCEFCRTEVTYLGHVINAHGMRTDPKKLSAVRDMPEPTCTLELESFLGKTGYYQKFIDDYANLAHPLMRMKAKKVEFTFGETERVAFNKLKDALCLAPILRFPDFERDFFISTDASGYGLGAVLFQKSGNEGEDELPIGYASRTLKDAELRYSATEREALAVWWACDHFIDYIDGQKVTIYTDHRALLALPQKELSNRRLQLIAHKLMEFQYTIEYRPGKQNANADTLSRYPIVPCQGRRSKEIQTNESDANGYNPEEDLSGLGRLPKFKRPSALPTVTEVTEAAAKMDGQAKISAVTLTLPPPEARRISAYLRDIVALQNKVPEYRSIRAYIETGLIPEQPRLRHELLRLVDTFFCDEASNALYRLVDRDKEAVLCIPPELYKTVLYDAHTSPSAGHMGIVKTLYRIRERYWWPAMVKTVMEYVRDCPLCQAHKERPRPPRERLGDRPPPGFPWERLHMDVWSPGAKQQASQSGNKHVLGVVDAFSKFVVLIPIPNQTAMTISDAIVEHLMLPFGMPRELVSDGASNFGAALQQELYAIFGVTRKVSTPYRPQTNGQVERVFRTIRPILATLANRTPKNWDKYLAFAAYSYNTSYHAAIKNTPFYILFGRVPHPLPDLHAEATNEDNFERLKRWRIARNAAAHGLFEDQIRSKTYYDTQRARPQLEPKIGDCVLVRVVKAPQDAVYKLYPKYIGPYRVIEINGPILTVAPLHHPGPRVTQRVVRYKIHKDRTRTCDENYPNIHTWRELISPFTIAATVDPNIEHEGPD